MDKLSMSDRLMSIPSGKKIKKQVSRFCDTTELDGFAYAKQSNCLEERFLWVLSTGIFFGFMTLFLYYQYVDYNESPTVTRVEIHYSNSLQVPDPTVCVPLNISAMENQFEKKNFGHWTSKPKAVRVFYKNMQNNPFFDEDFKNTLFGFGLNCSGQCRYTEVFRRWLVLMTGYISETVKLESFIQGKDANHTFEDIRNMIAPAKTTTYMGVTNEIEDHIESLQSQWNVTLLDIIKVVGTALCRTLDIRLKQDILETHTGLDLNLSYTYPCTVDRITWLGPVPSFRDYKDVLCVSLANLSMFNFTSRRDSVKLLAGPLNLYKLEDWVSQKKLQNYGIYLKPGGERVFSMSAGTQNLLRIPAHMSSRVPSEITGIYQAYPTKRDCTDGDTPMSECLQRCRVATFLRLCGCFPMTHFSMKYPDINSNQTCTIKRLTNTTEVGPDCLELTRFNSKDSDCEGKCKPPCTVKLFNFKPVSYRQYKLNESDGFSKVEGDIMNYYTKSVLHFQRFSYPVYMEKWNKNLLEIISDTGNIAGLWLGASLLALIHVIIYIITAFLDFIFANRLSSLPTRYTSFFCYRGQHEHMSRSKKLNAAGIKIRSDLEQLLDSVASKTSALNRRVHSRYNKNNQNKIESRL